MNPALLDGNDDSGSTYRSPAARQIRYSELVRQIQERGGVVGRRQGGEISEMEIQFLERTLMWETGVRSTHQDWLARRGRRFPPPDELSGERLKTELWRLIKGLAEARVFLEHTDHLPDDELYRRLWTEVLAAECPDAARTPDDACHWDMADPTNDEGETWLRFYASDIEREEWKAGSPETPLSPRESPPHDRDRRLPARN